VADAQQTGAIAQPTQDATHDQPYQALYRRYRPQRFADVKGQEHVSRALANAVREDKVAHAYLFSGPRGTGKTSTARILAMALNCESPQAGEPDGTCPSCVAVRSGASMDVLELDAASNRKLDEMRDLLSRVALGTPGRWKVYIIDEVHQLTPDAASALLKTLEEPPSHVVFVLATTDPQKVLPTILSRTQHFEFHLLDGELLTGLLAEINQDAGLGLSSGALRLAVERGRGSARDAESALEQLAATGGDQDDKPSVADLAGALAERDVAQTLQAVAQAIAAGKEPRRLGSDLVDYLRNAFLASQAPSLVLWPGAATAELTEHARRMGMPLLVRCMETVGQALIEMRDSVDPRVTLEVALIRLASPAADTSPSALLERVERLERALAERGSATAAHSLPAQPGPAATHAAPSTVLRGQQSAPSPVAATPVAATPVAVTPVAAPASGAGATPQTSGPAQARMALGAFLKAGTPPGSTPPGSTPPGSTPPGSTPPGAAAAAPTRDELSKAWGDTVLAGLGGAARAYLANGRFVEVKNGTAVFALPDHGLVERSANFVPEAEAALAAHFGRPVPLRVVLDRAGAAATSTAEPPVDDEESYDLDELTETAIAPAAPVEQRILEAFPGSVLDG